MLSMSSNGPRMGMGHYERLFLESLALPVGDGRLRFDIVFDGRAKGQEVDRAFAGHGMEAATFAGVSSARLARLPWWAARAAARWMGGRGGWPDVYHSLSLSLPAPACAPAVYTIHDLPPARFADEGRLPRWAVKAARAAAAVLTPSAFAKRELVELLGLRPADVHVIPYGCEHDRFHPGVDPASAAVLAGLGLAGDYLLYVGGFTQRKNVRNLLAAWDRSRGEVARRDAGAGRAGGAVAGAG